MSTTKKLHILSTCVVLAVATIIAFGPLCQNEFINYDDDDYVTENPQVRAGLTRKSVVWAFTTPHAANWHPLTWLSHMLDCELFGPDPLWHHLTSLLFHIANSLLLFLVLQRMTGAVWPSGFVAAVFALHPLHVESVAWVAERKDVLSTFFWMLTIAAYIRYAKRPGIGRFLLVFLAFGSGLMAKPMLVTLPFVLLLLDYWPLGRFGAEQAKNSVYQRATFSGLVIEKIPLFVLTVVSCAVTYLVQQSIGAVALIKVVGLKLRLANAVVSCGNYIWKMVWPSRLAVFYPYDSTRPIWQIAAAGLVLAGVSAVVFLLRRRPYLAVGWLWYLGTLVPVIGLVQVGQQSMADRYTYVPLIGLFIMIVWGSHSLSAKWRVRRIVPGVIVAAVVSALMICTWRQVGYWRNSITLFEHTLAVTSRNHQAHVNLGLALSNRGMRGDIDKAIEHYRKALPLDPKPASVYSLLGSALTKRGELDEAIEQHREALRLDPNSSSAHINLGIALAAKHKHAEAIRHYREALRLEPDNATAHNNLGAAILGMHGEPEEAAKHFREALRLKPDYDNAHLNIATVLMIQGRVDEAISHYEEMLRLNPNNIRARRALEAALARQNESHRQESSE